MRNHEEQFEGVFRVHPVVIVVGTKVRHRWRWWIRPHLEDAAPPWVVVGVIFARPPASAPPMDVFGKYKDVPPHGTSVASGSPLSIRIFPKKCGQCSWIDPNGMPHCMPSSGHSPYPPKSKMSFTDDVIMVPLFLGGNNDANSVTSGDVAVFRFEHHPKAGTHIIPARVDVATTNMVVAVVIRGDVGRWSVSRERSSR